MGLGLTKEEERVPGLGKPEAEIVRLMMPVYYNDEPLTDNELELAKYTWSLIVKSTSPLFLRKRKEPSFPHDKCIMFFYNSFYERLFDIHPVAKDLFKDVNSQGKFLVKMISLSLSEKADPVKYEQTLQKLAEIHNERGIKAVEYGLVGEVLFWAIRQCIGLESYTNEVHQAWVKIYSRMLRTMVPVAVAYELKDGSAQAKRMCAVHIGMNLSAEEEESLNSIKNQNLLYEAVKNHEISLDIDIQS
eukprot:gene3562-3901_t